MQPHRDGSKDEALTTRDGASELFARHSAGIYRYCLRRLRSPEEAEDALQATYLNAWRSLKSGFRPTNPRPWLFQIAANVCTSDLRSKLGGTRVELRDPEAFDELAQIEQPGTEALHDLTEAVRELPVRQRHALVLRDWQGLAYDEIAAEMALSNAAVETLLFRARKSVAATLANRDWRPKVATSLRALVVWPFGLFPARSAAAGGAGQVKTGILIGCGTVAPLVAFGILQVLVFGGKPAGQAGPRIADPPAIAVEAPLSWLGEERMPRALPASDKPISAPRDRDRRKGGKGAHESKGAGTPTPPSPAPAETPAASGAQNNGVVLCHATQSNVKPGVTITVASQAAAHGLGKDSPGHC